MMNKKLIALFILCMGIAITGCNGSSGDNGSDPFSPNPQDDVISLDLTVLDANCEAVDTPSFTQGESLCVQASLKVNGTIQAAEIISFDASLGTLSSQTKLTDNQGIAQVMLNSQDANIGAASIIATFNENSVQANYEFLAAQQDDQSASKINISLANANGDPVTRFKSDEPITVNAILLNAQGEALSNQILSFQSSLGELSINDALTNQNGVAQTILDAGLAAPGAGTVTVTLQTDEALLTNAINFEVQANDDNAGDDLQFGYFDGNTFIPNVLGLSGFSATQDAQISAGATLGILVGIADANGSPLSSSTPISFNSNCVLAGDATLDQSVNTINGVANATYKDLSCATGTGNQDELSASVNINGTPVTLTRIISLAPESVGAIEFVSAEPSNIVLQGTGGQGAQTVSTVTFLVKGSEGNPLAQQTVNFSLNTESGGLTLAPASGLTNSQGQVSVRVTAGNVPTSVRVTATVDTAQGTSIQTQSDLLSVNTGLPDQNSFSLAASNLNPEAFDIQGQQVSVTARLADTFNNPVPDGTTVSFTAEGGNIQPSCTTTAGACSVIWTSADPKPQNHRVTILATAIGHETLIDSNGNNLYDDTDGGAISGNSGNGYDVTLASQAGFVDLPEAWRDDDEDGVKDANEIFLDFNSSGSYDAANTLFDGPQCQGANCGLSSLHVRRAMTLITSSSATLIEVSANGSIVASNQGAGNQTVAIARGQSQRFVLTYSDTAGQPIASESTIDVQATSGDLAGVVTDVMPQSNNNGPRSTSFTLVNNLLADDSALDSVISVRIVSPSGVVSEVNFTVNLL